MFVRCGWEMNWRMILTLARQFDIVELVWSQVLVFQPPPSPHLPKNHGIIVSFETKPGYPRQTRTVFQSCWGVSFDRSSTQTCASCTAGTTGKETGCKEECCSKQELKLVEDITEAPSPKWSLHWQGIKQAFVSVLNSSRETWECVYHGARGLFLSLSWRVLSTLAKLMAAQYFQSACWNFYCSQCHHSPRGSKLRWL